MIKLKVGLCVPTLNAGERWSTWLDALKEQTFSLDQILVIDSMSDDNTVALAESYGINCVKINRSEFNHGGTRNRALSLLKGLDVVIFMTQDAILASDTSIEQLVDFLDDSGASAVYGKQLPHDDADILAIHARQYNYKDESYVYSEADIPRCGIKTVFLSNSFAAYRKDDLLSVGGFPEDVILAEDSYVAAKLILAGKKVGYCASSVVFHSHNYTLMEEFKRYFDIGVFHTRQDWIRKRFGVAEGEGLRSVVSELRLMFPRYLYLIPYAFLKTLFKYAGYRAGLKEAILPRKLKYFLSMHRGFWFSKG